jgi:glycosyltransferase involved in cell wall biosynthesis
MISILIPAYNEENSIKKTIISYRDMMLSLKLEHEIIVIDDGSTDETKKIAENQGARVIAHPHNAGYGQALKSGIKIAKYDSILITDGDETYSTDILGQMINAYYKDGFDMVVAARINFKELDGPLKLILRKLLKLLVEFTTGRTVPDINSGLRLFSKKTIAPFMPHLCNTFSFTTSLTLAYMMNAKYIEYIPLEYRKRVGKTKVRLFRDSIRTLQYVLEAILFFNPIKIFLIVTGISLLISLGIIFLSLIINNLILGVLGSILLLFSGLSLLIGFISIQLKQINIDNNSTN